MGSLVQQVNARWATSAYTPGSAPVNLPGAATIGNRIIVMQMWDRASPRTPVSVVDAAGTTYTLCRTEDVTADIAAVCIWEGAAGATNAGQGVVATLSGNAGEGAIIVMEVSGLAADQSTLSANGNNTLSAQSLDSGNVTPPNANGFIATIVYRGNRTWTEDPDFTEIPHGAGTDIWFWGYIENPAASAQSLSYSTGDSATTGVVQIVAFVGAAAGGDPEGSLIGGKLLRGGLLLHGVLGR